MEVTGGKVNRGTGYDLEVPCIYRLYGHKVYTDRMKEIFKVVVIVKMNNALQ